MNLIQVMLAKGISLKSPVLWIVTCLGLAAWQWLPPALGIPDHLVSSPWGVWQTLVSDAPVIAEQTRFTLMEWLVGLVISLLCGFGIAVACFASRRVRDVLMPVLIVSQSVPYIAFAPLLLIWLGLGMAPKIVLVALSCAFPIALSLEEGLRKGFEEFRLVVAMIKLDRLRAFWNVYLPSALSDFFTGLKMSASYAFVSTVMAEFIGSESGLGIYMTRAQSAYRADRVIAAVVIIISISLFTAWLVDRLKARVVFWQVARK